MKRDIFKRGNLAIDAPGEGAGEPLRAVAEEGVPDRGSDQRAKTAPGAMVNFMVQRSEIHKEVEQLKQRLQEFEGATVARLIDPALIRDSEWANRHEDSFRTSNFADFKEDIRRAGGNVQAIKVRKLTRGEGGVSPGNTPLAYEIVFGHRRCRACMELGLPVLALVEVSLEDQAMFVEMFRENLGREDLTPWEQGVMHAHAISSGLFPSLRQLAKAVGQDPGTISKTLSLAQLPKSVVSAFSSPLVLQYRWVAPLNEVLQKDPDGLIERATELAQEQEARRAAGAVPVGEAEVLARLLGQPSSRSSPTATWIEVDGKRLARLKVDAAGRPSVDFKLPMSGARREALTALLREFLIGK